MEHFAILHDGTMNGQDTIDLMKEVADAVDPGNDSGVYALNRALKAVARKMAVQAVGATV